MSWQGAWLGSSAGAWWGYSAEVQSSSSPAGSSKNRRIHPRYIYEEETARPEPVAQPVKEIVIQTPAVVLEGPKREKLRLEPLRIEQIPMQIPAELAALLAKKLRTEQDEREIELLLLML